MQRGLPQVRLFVVPFFPKAQQKSICVVFCLRVYFHHVLEIASWVLKLSTKTTQKQCFQPTKHCFFLVLSLAILFPFEGSRSQLSKNPPTNVACCHGFRGQVTVWVVSWCSFHRPMFFRIFSGHEPNKKCQKIPKNGWNKTQPAVILLFWTWSKGRCGNFGRVP